MAWLRILLLLCLPLTAEAHLGSQNVFFEGPAGPYPVRVTIEPPPVVPGLAQIHVRVRSGDATTVTVLPVRWDAGTKGAPPPDVATLVPGEKDLFTAQLWLMNSGAYSVFVDVSGPRGHGTAIVPINSLATRRLGMSRGMSLMFLGFGTFIVALLASVVGAAVRESILPAGVEPTARRRSAAALAMIFTVIVVGGFLYFGKNWWDSVDRSFRNNRLYRAQSITSALTADAEGHQQLSLGIGKSESRRADSTPLLSDHGHLVHLFLISPRGDAFVHLHPVRAAGDRARFDTQLPAIPAGDYQLYADITHESGLTQTLTNLLHLDAASNAGSAIDADDSFTLAAPQPPQPATFPGGFLLTPQFTNRFRANDEVTLQFEMTTNGAPAPLEPYLGMYGHLIIQHADGTVFTHLHPLGSISMAAQKRFAEREHAGYLANQSLDLLCSPATPTLSFPYAFPKAGQYRLWLQTKVLGEVRTAAYSVTVE